MPYFLLPDQGVNSILWVNEMDAKIDVIAEDCIKYLPKVCMTNQAIEVCLPYICNLTHLLTWQIVSDGTDKTWECMNPLLDSDRAFILHRKLWWGMESWPSLKRSIWPESSQALKEAETIMQVVSTVIGIWTTQLFLRVVMTLAAQVRSKLTKITRLEGSEWGVDASVEENSGNRVHWFGLGKSGKKRR